MEYNDQLLESDINMSGFQQQTTAVENSSRPAVLNEADCRNECTVATDSNEKESVRNDNAFLAGEREISSVSNSTEANVDRLSGLAAIADSYSGLDTETYAEQPADSVDSFIEDEHCEEVQHNNGVNTCHIDTISVSEKHTSLENQKNDINSVNAMDTPSQYTELETDQVTNHTLNTSGNNGSTLVEAVNIGDTVIEPVNIGNAVVEPVNIGNAVVEPVNIGDTVVEPVNIGNAVVEPIDIGNAVLEPVDIGNAVTEPVNIENAVIEPVNIGNKVMEPVNIGNAVIEPVNVGNAVIEPVNIGNTVVEPVNIENAVKDPVNIGNKVIEPDNIENAVIEPVNIGNKVMEPVNIGNTVIEPVNIGNAVIEPVNIGNAVIEPVNVGNAVIEPVNIGNTVVEPVNIENAVKDPVNIGNAVIEPVNIGNAVIEPVNIGNKVIEPDNIENAVIEPVNIGNTVMEPVNIENAVIEPVNIGNKVIEPDNIENAVMEPVDIENTVIEPDNIGNTVIEPDNIGNTVIEPVNIGNTVVDPVNVRNVIKEPVNIGNMPSDSDKVNQVYAMSNIDKELDSICVKESDPPCSDSSSDSDDDSSSSESSTSSESSSEDDLQDIRKKIEKEEEQVPTGPLKTKSEVFIRDLPEVPDLVISIDDNVQLVELGLVFSIVESLVVVKALPQTPALDTDSILFLESRSCLGLVFETFGPVQIPFYSVRFNKESDISDKNVHVGDKVFYAPDIMEYSHYVFIAQLKRLKGSDASWEHDEEPPQEVVEYSDDEEEVSAKASRKKERKARGGCSADDENTQKMQESGKTFHQGANRGGRKRTWQNRAKGQAVNQNQGMPHTNTGPLPHPAYRGPAPWHGGALPMQAPERPYMGHPPHEAMHFGMHPMGPPLGIPLNGPPPRGPMVMVPGPMRQFPVTHPGPMTNALRPSFGPGFQGPWPVGPPSGFIPRYQVPAPQGYQDIGFQGNFMGFGMPPPPPPPPPPSM